MSESERWIVLETCNRGNCKNRVHGPYYVEKYASYKCEYLSKRKMDGNGPVMKHRYKVLKESDYLTELMLKGLGNDV